MTILRPFCDRASITTRSGGQALDRSAPSIRHLKKRVQPHALVAVVAEALGLQQLLALLVVLAFEESLRLAEERQPRAGELAPCVGRARARMRLIFGAPIQRSSSSSSDRKNWYVPGSPCRAAAPHKLPVDPVRRVHFGGDDVQATRRPHVVVQQNVGPAARHVRRDRHPPRVPARLTISASCIARCSAFELW